MIVNAALLLERSRNSDCICRNRDIRGGLHSGISAGKMVMNPSGWNASDEQGYQQELANLKARLNDAMSKGTIEQIVSVQNDLATMSHPETGRAYYLKAKANGWL